MSMANEVILIVAAGSLGFTVATGINFKYFDSIAQTAEIQANNGTVKHIPAFWNRYSEIGGVKETAEKSSERKLCVLIDNDKICVEDVE